ncbi:hypothetical protein JTE90_026387 [Oedothorax gibbosus]|uniref:Uncharacterized protein n=1 Tax=Oedothorax gibbosus TaxID=931172 RepID=A0AAV6VDG5_9ARAC|nr:hypothetical protein JTE90_026387 [Oedothorax gibbosus]
MDFAAPLTRFFPATFKPTTGLLSRLEDEQHGSTNSTLIVHCVSVEFLICKSFSRNDMRMRKSQRRGQRRITGLRGAAHACSISRIVWKEQFPCSNKGFDHAERVGPLFAVKVKGRTRV